MRRLLHMAAALVLAGLALVSTTTESAGAADAVQSSAITDLGACIAGGGGGDILLLVDDSGSLRHTDPAGQRVTAASFFVRQLARDVQEQKLDISVAVTTFSTAAGDPLVGWTGLGDGADAVVAGLEDLRGRDRAEQTDYVGALQGAQATLAERATARGEAQSCQAIALFTDGKLDYEGMDNEAALLAAGPGKLCDAGGIADQLRASGVFLFAVALNGEGTVPEDFDLMKRVAMSGDGGQACGSKPARGAFFLASDVDGLLLAFHDFAVLHDPPQPLEGAICQVKMCKTPEQSFVLDPSITRVSLFAQGTGVDGLTSALLRPDGTVVEMPAGGSIGVEQSDPASGISWTWESAHSITVNLAAPAADAAGSRWTGQWGFAFIDAAGGSSGATSKAYIRLSGDVVPTWKAPPADAPWHVDDQVDGVQFGLATGAGDPIDPKSLLGTVAYTATLVDASGTSTTLLAADSGEKIAEPTRVNLKSMAIGPATLTLNVKITTAAVTVGGAQVPGTALEPVSASFPVTLVAPATYPVVATRIDFGRHEVKSSGKTIAIPGAIALSGEGCAWIAPDAKLEVTAPAELGKVTVTADAATSADTCAAGSAGTLPVTLHLDEPGNATLSGTVSVSLGSSDKTGDVRQVVVPFRGTIVKPLSEVNFWLTLVAALILGPGLPLAALYLAKVLVSKVPARALVGRVIPVTVEHGSVLRDGAAFTLSATDLTGTVPIDVGGSRTINVEHVVLKATAGVSPLGVGYVRVDAPGQVSASDASPSTDRSGVRAKLPLAVHNHWVVLWTPGSSPTAAQVLVLIAGEAGPDQHRAIEDDIRGRLADVLDALTRAAGTSEESAGDPADGSLFGDAAPVASSFTWDSDSSWGGGPVAGPTASGPAASPAEPGGSASPWDAGPATEPPPQGGATNPWSWGS